MVLSEISFAGAGRVSSALAEKIHNSGYKIGLIVSTTGQKGIALASSLEAEWSSEPVFPSSTELIIVAVPDHRLEGVLAELRCGEKTLVAHTAGSLGLDVFPERISRKGVFYPLQTFTLGRQVDFAELPFLLEASDEDSLSALRELASGIGGKPYFTDSMQRRFIHLAAVFICNFTNHMLTDGKQLANMAGVPLNIFYPLLNETISKAMDIGPDNAQTGPALRNDRNIIEKHLELLSFSPDLQNTYRIITESIIDHYKNSL
jgi:predicted short-subunit dehydrogenase-like oxidoreductase (DUF2520 family)